MPIVNCPQCGKKVSDYKKQCPNCGSITEKETEREALRATVRETAKKAEHAEFEREAPQETIPESATKTEREETDLEKSFNRLITCLACDKKMSKQAAACPNCGEPNPLAKLNSIFHEKETRTGITAGIIASILAIIGTVMLGTIFVPLAVITAIAGTYHAIRGRDAGGIGINLLAWVLILIGLFTSPLLLSIIGYSLID
ncbi:MAG: hypothetical protein JKX87_07420 [Cycloclasticus sp.]|nr:hypothetical protein [Cycloclasticus sp.]